MGEKLKIAYAYLDGLTKITESDAKILTHINIAFGLIGSDGLLRTDGLRHMDMIPQIKRWNPSIKFVLSVGGWGAGGFSEMSRLDAGRKAFAQSCAKYVDEQGLDGIDIDWEYPCIDWGGIVSDSADKSNYTLLLGELRNALGNDRILSVAVGAGEFFIANTEMDKVADICDYVQLMTYDMRAEGCFVAGHHTALYASEGDTEGRSVHDSVKRFIKAGVPAEKIVIGAAFYSRIWREVDTDDDVNVNDAGGADTNNNGSNASENVNNALSKYGLMMPAKGEGVYGYSYTQLVKEFIDKNGFVRYKDDKAMASFLFNGSDFISYDDPESIAAKCEYIKENGLLGIMYWEHGCDETHELIESIRL